LTVQERIALRLKTQTSDDLDKLFAQSSLENTKKICTVDSIEFTMSDLYRLKDANEAIGAGVEDCIYSGNYCFIEWPERAKALFPNDVVNCIIESLDSNHRKLKLIL
jgi:hypothetical protein